MPGRMKQEEAQQDNSWFAFGLSCLEEGLPGNTSALNGRLPVMFTTNRLRLRSVRSRRRCRVPLPAESLLMSDRMVHALALARQACLGSRLHLGINMQPSLCTEP